MDPKPRSDSKLDSLNPELKEMLRGWLLDENLSYAAAKDRLLQDFNVRTSERALHKFYRSRCFVLRSSEAKAFAEEAVRIAKDSSQDYDEAIGALVKQRAFELAYARDGDLDALQIVTKILGDSAKLDLKRKDQLLAERRIALLEQKAAQADQARLVSADAELTAEEKETRLKAIFGIS